MKSEIKILVFQVREMSNAGLMQWRRKLRGKVKRMVYVPIKYPNRLPVEINTKNKLGEWIADNFGDGIFIIRGFTKGATKTRIKFNHLAKLKITMIPSSDIESKYKVTFFDTNGLRRYKFWLSK